MEGSNATSAALGSTYRKASYINFTINLRTKDGSHNSKFSQFKEEWIPLPYACPVAVACNGGMDSSCTTGYEGPLCAVCSSGHYNLVSRCRQCPSIAWIAGQIVIVVMVLIFLAAVIVKDRKKDGGQRSITDIVLARVKIVITFYQITSITVESFSYVRWPSAMIQIQEYVKFIQLNLLQITPVHCINHSLKMDSYARVIFHICFNISTILAVFSYYHLKKIYLKQRSTRTGDQLNLSVSKLKERCWRNATLILFIIYPSTSLQILQILPPTCHKICSYKGDTFCSQYLRFDYSVSCDSGVYKKGTPFFWLSSIYVVLFPIVMLALLFKYARDNGESLTNHEEAVNQQGKEIKAGLSFLFENYSPSCWFWEMIELGRKIVFTLAIVLADTESRSYFAFLVIFSGLYAVLVAYHKPIRDEFEYWLQLVSLLASLANLIVGMLLKIPVDESHSAVVRETDSVAVTVLMIAANVIVIAIVAGMSTTVF